MQFEPPLGNTFQAYRKATDDVVQWITTTARATGTVEHLLDQGASAGRRSLIQMLKDKSAVPLSFVSKPKGRNRNQKKSKANASMTPTIQISYKTLSCLGRAIAKADNVEMDFNVLVVLKGIIHARKTFATNNKWRRRIIRLLEDLLRDLQCRPPSLAQAAIIDKLAASSNRADSMFEGVERVEITESLYYTKPIEIPHKKDRYIYKLNECLEDTAFAVYCFMQDATYLRLFSTRAWHEFALGEIGIETATFCTNSVDGHIGEMSEELRRTFDHFNDTWMTRMHTKVDAFLRQQCANDAHVSHALFEQIKPSCEDVSFARHATRRLGYYASALLCVKTTRLIFQAFLASREGYWGEGRDEFRLLKSLCQLRCLECSTGEVSSTFRRDCMHSAAQALVSGHIDTDAVFAAQMLHDIQQQVNPQRVATEDILEQVSQDYLNLYYMYGPIWHNEKLSAIRPARTKRMYERYSLLHQIVHSPDQRRMQDNMENHEHEHGRKFILPGFQLLRHVPSLIGQLVTRYRVDFHLDFLEIANDAAHILTAIHLYNAAEATGALQTKCWRDMEWVIDRQSHDAIFGGEPPKTVAEYSRRFCVAYGLDSTKFTTGRKLQVAEQVKNNIHLKGSFPRRLESCSQLLRIFSEGRKAHSINPLGHQGIVETTEEFADGQLDWSAPYGVPNKIGVLIAAKESYDGDEEALCFDIFNFHLRCTRLLMDIRDLCLKEAPEDYPAIRFGGEDGVNPTLAELLRDLTDSPRHCERMWPKAVKLLGDMIEEEGSACIEQAIERMKMTTMDSINLDSDTSSDSVQETSTVQSPKDGAPGTSSLVHGISAAQGL
ncbi:hypothetical protein SVAN01_01341 [Stagonosporopsis vannaccii]|nr:hypothetical protein SVAN01_01341 [Stagonosporopsis vannaccii]